MGGPDWALVALIVYPLLQIPLVLYLARWFELDGDAPVVTPTMAYWTGQRPDGPFRHERDHRPGRCRRCGADNDPGYTFCGNCVARL